jgi:hypothetical protein
MVGSEMLSKPNKKKKRNKRMVTPETQKALLVFDQRN